MPTRSLIRTLAAAAVAMCCTIPAAAQEAAAESGSLSLPNIFGSHMVLQREAEVPVFGTAPAGSTVSITFGSEEVSGTADDSGHFEVRLPAMEASAEGRTLTVIAGEQTKTFEDVLVGEVWVCSGQSNMEWPVSAADEAEIELAMANQPLIRLIEIEKAVSLEPTDNVTGQWTPCTPESVRDFSAVGYFFGRTLQQTLGVPVGLIDTTWGGTRAEAWTPAETLASEPSLDVIKKTWDDRGAAFDPAKAEASYEQALEQWKTRWAAFRTKQKAGDIPPGQQGPRKPRLPENPDKSQHGPSRLWNAMVDAMVPYAIRGVVWYQGESNAPRAKQYRTVMPTMIRGWRDKWGQGDFPFYQVQLANFREKTDGPTESDWAELREAQDLTTEALPNVGKVTITDIGAILDIHPKDKQNVAKRLARLALVDVYGYEMSREGPQFESMSIDEGKAVIQFTGLGTGPYRGLETDYRQPLRGFTIAADDREWVDAKCRIVGQTVVCEHPNGKTPVAVRYNWADNPSGTLQNRAGLPAEPFRTDDWPGVTDASVKP